ncbi:helix-turn-helix domain-containing protein [Niallia nealsonii]|uniref:XRE family transcriptional regulator n=1 Tax=Niallia nealsonii TaxID=115979 RepID=A0A2N0Z328_9BACI|nr:helix-turn-helix transcriptional regulator [Niallia nealsonii]PKG23921.1 XRE family transcriptional regulator [Niallia nealsonii]
MASLKERLKELRKIHKLTQSNVAEFLGISESAYGYYEQGRNEPSLASLKILADKYNVNTSYLLGETDIPSKDIAKIIVAGEEITLTAEEYKVFEELKKHPILFHDLAKNPEKKIKELIKLQKAKNLFLDDDDEEENRGDGFGEFED